MVGQICKEKGYVMKGNPGTGRLKVPHLIVAQSYKCDFSCVGCNAVGNGECIDLERMLKIVDDCRGYNEVGIRTVPAGGVKRAITSISSSVFWL